MFSNSAVGTCLPAVAFEAFGGLIPGADLADICTERASDLDGDIDLGCCCAIFLQAVLHGRACSLRLQQDKTERQ